MTDDRPQTFKVEPLPFVDRELRHVRREITSVLRRLRTEPSDVLLDDLARLRETERVLLELFGTDPF